jgi:hypothetical protein
MVKKSTHHSFLVFFGFPEEDFEVLVAIVVKIFQLRRLRKKSICCVALHCNHEGHEEKE